MDNTDITIIEAKRIKRHEYYVKNKERILNTNKKSKEKNREKILQGKKDYYNKVKNKQEWQDKEKAKRILNKENKKQYDIKYHEKNKELKIKKSIKWNKENKKKRAVIIFNYDSKRRAQIKSGCTSKELLEWKNKQTKICYWCNKICIDNFHIDHYMPLSKGGKHELNNLVISCPSCNLSKNAKSPLEFANKIGRLF
jgi:5-methylcytosine-specific restriction endonuclease McrA